MRRGTGVCSLDATFAVLQESFAAFSPFLASGCLLSSFLLIVPLFRGSRVFALGVADMTQAAYPAYMLESG